MSTNWYTPWVTEMLSFMRTAWPEANCFTSIQALRMNVTSQVSRQNQSITNNITKAPWGILWQGEAMQKPTGIGNMTARLPVTFYYVDQIDATTTPDEERLSNKIWTLKSLIDEVNSPFTSCERIEYGSVNSGASLPENLAFLGHKGAIEAASLSYEPGFMVGYLKT